MTSFATTNELYEARGTMHGPSKWRRITQEQIDTFARLADDHQWIHVDVERARTGPFGGPIAHGMLTVAYVPTILGELVEVERTSFGVNYGFDRVRFLSPVPAGARIRGHVEIVDAVHVEGGVRGTFRVTVEVEGAERPACVADNIVVFYD